MRDENTSFAGQNIIGECNACGRNDKSFLSIKQFQAEHQ